MAGFRPRMGVGRRLIGWVAAYALVLHAVLAGIVATQLAATNARGAVHGFELCLTDSDAASLPGNNHAQHENCAIHCNTIAGGGTANVLAVLALVFSSTARCAVYSVPAAGLDLLRRAGLGSRAPPLPA